MLQGKAPPAPGTEPGLPFSIHHYMLSVFGIHHLENLNLAAMAQRPRLDLVRDGAAVARQGRRGRGDPAGGDRRARPALKENPMSEDRAAIEAVVQTYLDGLYEGDVEKLAAAFHPTSSLTYEENGALTPLPRDQWLEAVRNRPSPQSRGLPRHDRILQIDQASPTTAFVKLNCAIPPRFFTDYLSLLKVEGRWQVAQKVFATERRD